MYNKVPANMNFVEREKNIEKFWEDEQIFKKSIDSRKQGPTYTFYDGPPTANGKPHIGHVLTRVIKDMIPRYRAMKGYMVPRKAGWDTHGLPVELEVEKMLGLDGKEQIEQYGLEPFIEHCKESVWKYKGMWEKFSNTVGFWADMEHPYVTYHNSFIESEWWALKEIWNKGLLYKGFKIVPYCPRCGTPLSSHEVAQGYKDVKQTTAFVKFKVKGAENTYILAWTTTPWTLPANTAVSLAPDADYVMVTVGGDNLIMAKELVETVAEVAGWEDYDFVRGADDEPVALTGKQLFGLTYTAPVRRDIKGTVIYGDHVTLDTGTGAVHTAPGHGQDDYLVALEFDIPMLMPVDDNGVFTGEAGQFAGLSTDEANPVIIDWLREQGTLVAEKKINHSYPHCWRCHEPVIFRATDQWFVSMDKNALREDALRAINSEVEWIPAWAKNRIGAMVGDRPDWCISRQRSWGVPIPVFKCAKCGNTVATAETFDAVIELFNTKGADAWFTEAPSDYLPRGTKCEVCGGTELIPEKDILDVWWESGVSHTSVCRHRAEADGLTFPADMYLEGSDQHRGWFQSSLLTSIGAYGVPPYRSVMHCGFTVDEEGRKMSKSLGNGIDPEEMCNKFGADVLRLWVSSCDYSQDVSISENILKQVSDAYRRFRNTFRFLLGNLNDFTPDDFVGDWDALEPLDQWAMVRLSQLLADVEAAYESYRFNSVYRALYDYVNDISAVYMDVTKDRLYAEAPASPRRRAVQTVLMNILEVLVRVMAPILSFTTDEVWECYPPAFRDIEGREASVQLAGWPTARDFVPALPADAGAQVATMEEMMAVREVVTKALEEARNEKIIGKSQEASLTVTAPAALVATAGSFDPSVFEELFIVASVQFVEGDGDEITAEVTVAEGEKCPRCWNIRELGGNPRHPDVCERCGDALDAIEGGAE